MKIENYKTQRDPQSKIHVRILVPKAGTIMKAVAGGIGSVDVYICIISYPEGIR